MSSPVLTTTVRAHRGTRGPPRGGTSPPRPRPQAPRSASRHSVVGSPRWPRRPRSSCVAPSLAPGRGRRFRWTRPRRSCPRGEPTSSTSWRLAAGLRDLGHGHTVTYSRKVFIPLTMLCRDHCHYCTFAKPPAKLDHPFLTPDEVVAIAEAGRRMGCKEALFTLGDRPEERYDVAPAVAGGARVRLDARLPARRRDPRDRGDRPPPTSEPRRDELRGARAAEARERLDGHDAGDVVRPAGGARGSALRFARQGPGRSAADDRGRRSSRHPVHDGHPRRHRRDGARARRVVVRDPRPPPALPPRARGDRAELPREAGHGDASRARAGRRGVPGGRRRGADRARAAHEHPGAAEPLRSRRSSCGSWTPGSTIGAASRP